MNMLVVQLHLPERACRGVLRGAPMLHGREVATLMLPAGWDEYMDDEMAMDGDATGSDTDSYMRAPSSAAPARQASRSASPAHQRLPTVYEDGGKTSLQAREPGHNRAPRPNRECTTAPPQGHHLKGWLEHAAPGPIPRQRDMPLTFVPTCAQVPTVP